MLTIQKLPLCSKGAPVAITLENSNHMRVTLLSYGATIQSIVVPGRNGVLTDVLIKVVTGDAKKVHPVLYVLCIPLVLYFIV